MDHLISERLARPAAVLSTLAALAGSVFIFWATATGNYWWAVWGGFSFTGAALLWHLSDRAAASDAGDTP